MRESIAIPKFVNDENWLRKRSIDFNQPLLICCWSIQCQSCKSIVQQTQSLSSNIQIIFIHVLLKDERVAKQHIKQISEQYGIMSPLYIDEDNTVARSLKLRFTPAVYLFDAQQKLRFLQQGTISMRLLRDRITRLQ